MISLRVDDAFKQSSLYAGGTGHTHLLQRQHRLLQFLLFHEQIVHSRVTDCSELLL